jgi:hypothetical protein
LPIERAGSIVQWHYVPYNHHQWRTLDIASRLNFINGVLHIAQYGPNDTYLLHEIGHLLTMPIDRWWRYIGHGRHDSNFDFGFKMPTSIEGIRRMCIHEIKAAVIEETLVARYPMTPRNVPFTTSLYEYCLHHFDALLPPITMPVDRVKLLYWIVDLYKAEPASFDYIMTCWQHLTRALEWKLTEFHQRQWPELDCG